jgi:hypothetical protein
MPRVIGVAVLAITLAACDRTASPGRATGGDTVRVRADGPPVWGDSVRLVEVARLGKVDGPAEYAFGHVAYVAGLSDGAFFVYDQGDGAIRRYDSTGRHTGVVARKGKGPSEVSGVGGLKTVGDSLLVVWDVGNRRVSIFDAQGKHVRGFPVMHARILSRITPAYPPGFAVDSAGNIAIRVAASATGGGTAQPGPVDQGTVVPEYWMRYSQTGAVVDSVRADRIEPARRPFDVYGIPNFTDRPYTTLLANGGVVTGWPDHYRFTLTGADRKPMVIDRPFRPIPLVGEERAEWQEINTAMGNVVKEGAAQGTMSTTAKPSEYVLPEAKPGFIDLRVDPVGQLWVQIYTAASKRALPPSKLGADAGVFERLQANGGMSWASDRRVYEVIDPAGRFLGRVDLPPNTSLLEIQRNRVWLRAEGPDGETVVATYRIVGPRGP